MRRAPTMQKDFSSARCDRLNGPANQTDPSPWTVAQNMNQRAKLSRLAGARWAGIRLVLSLVPGVAISASSSVAPETSPSASRPYLAAIGSPALRFGELPPPPDLRPAAGAPPVPKEEVSLQEPESPPPAASMPTPPESAEPTTNVAIAPVATKTQPARIPPPILPDDTRSKVRAEDFLPYFQFPANGANGDVTVIAPVAPAAGSVSPIPPSSATYRQQ